MTGINPYESPNDPEKRTTLLRTIRNLAFIACMLSMAAGIALGGFDQPPARQIAERVWLALTSLTMILCVAGIIVWVLQRR